MRGKEALDQLIEIFQQEHDVILTDREKAVLSFTLDMIRDYLKSIEKKWKDERHL